MVEIFFRIDSFDYCVNNNLSSKVFLIISSTISLCVLTTLFLYDQIRRFLKKFFR